MLRLSKTNFKHYFICATMIRAQDLPFIVEMLFDLVFLPDVA